MRETEERAAAARLGVKEVVFLRYPDGELQPTLDLRRQLTRLIRLKQPDIVVTNDPTVRWYGVGYINHPDHRAIGDAALDAVFPSARNHLIFPELHRDESSPHKVSRSTCRAQEPTVKVDITIICDQIAALYEHEPIAEGSHGAASENIDEQFAGDEGALHRVLPGFPSRLTQTAACHTRWSFVASDSECRTLTISSQPSTRAGGLDCAPPICTAIPN
jgi:LmbE family N-acetylglucosaminyl deacetylase